MLLEGGPERLQAAGDAGQEGVHPGEVIDLVVLQQVLELVPDGLDVLLDEHLLALVDEVWLRAGVQVLLHSSHLLPEASLNLHTTLVK